MRHSEVMHDNFNADGTRPSLNYARQLNTKLQND
jgi:hypothetical protein